MLTGKAKKDFEKWFVDNKLKFFEGLEISKKEQLMSACGSLTQFIGFKASGNCFGLSMQYGVYVDWGDSVDMEVFINYSRADMFRFDIFHNFISLGDGNLFKTRPEAQTAAVKKLDELYNSK